MKRIYSGRSYPASVDGRRGYLYVVRILRRGDEYQVVYQQHRNRNPGRIARWLAKTVRCGPSYFSFLLDQPVLDAVVEVESIDIPEERDSLK